MPGFIPDASGGKTLDGITLRGTGTTYLALLLAAPAHDTTLATMTELALSGYARQAVTWTAPTFDTNALAMATSNSGVLTFGPFTSDMLQVSAWAALVDAASGTTGNVKYFFQLEPSLEAPAGTPIQLDVGSLIIYSS